MSYLDPLRLHFAGTFKAAPSTVNNDPTHFNNATFVPQYREWGAGMDNGWWNPSGDAVFRLLNCAVTTAFRAGVEVSGDHVLSLRVTDSATRPPAKMVDLDSEQQMVSQIWGLQVRLCDAEGVDAMCGDLDVTSFTDIWFRDTGADAQTVGDGAYSPYYQSVLTNVVWAGNLASPFLRELRARTLAHTLSIHFVLDGYNMDHTSPGFTFGRIVGTIGPHTADEPRRLTLGRRLAPAVDGNGSQYYTVQYCTAVVDRETSKLLIDLGNSLPTSSLGGPQTDLGSLNVCYQAGGNWVPLCAIDYTAPGWYTRYAGISAVPIARGLNAQELAAIESGPLAVQLTSLSTGVTGLALVEATDGEWVRADQFVFRANPGENVEVDLWMTKWGKPLASGAIQVVADPSGLQGNPGVWPDVATPPDAISFPDTLISGPDGRATLHIATKDPGNPRDYIDGQVYGIRAFPASQAQSAQNPFDFVSLLLWDDFTPDTPITWYGSMYPIFQQYANLYPVMGRFLNLADYDQVCAGRNLQLLRLAFGLDMSDSNSMPVTRDLSAAKRKAILSWLTNVGPDGKPLLGEREVSDDPSTRVLPRSAAGQQTQKATTAPMKGGKGLALSRRIGLQARRQEAK